MFPFRSISQGHCGCFLMWFPLFIQHLLDNIGVDSQLCCHIGSRTTEWTTEGKRKTLQCYCTFSLDWISVCTVRHSWERWIHWSLVLSFGNAQHYLYPALLKTHLLVYLAVVWLLTMKLSGIAQWETIRLSRKEHVSNVINFLTARADTQYGMYMRLLTCQNQTMANVSPVQITFTIGCHL